MLRRVCGHVRIPPAHPLTVASRVGLASAPCHLLARRTWRQRRLPRPVCAALPWKPTPRRRTRSVSSRHCDRSALARAIAGSETNRSLQQHRFLDRVRRLRGRSRPLRRSRTHPASVWAGLGHCETIRLPPKFFGPHNPGYAGPFRRPGDKSTRDVAARSMAYLEEPSIWNHD